LRLQAPARQAEVDAVAGELTGALGKPAPWRGSDGQMTDQLFVYIGYMPRRGSWLAVDASDGGPGARLCKRRWVDPSYRE